MFHHSGVVNPYVPKKYEVIKHGIAIDRLGEGILAPRPLGSAKVIDTGHTQFEFESLPTGQINFAPLKRYKLFTTST